MRTLFVLLLAVCTFGQSAYNVKLSGGAVSNFGSDSLKVSPTFAAGDYEGLDIVIKAPTQDSSKFLVGYQRGYWDGGSIIWKRPYLVIDTFNTLTAANFQAVGVNIVAPADTDLAGAIDSAQFAGYTIMAKHVNAFRSPYGRIVLKGLTGNKNTKYTVFVTVSQPKYVRVDIGTGKQPE